MAKTGRPPTNGVRPGWMLLRDTIAIDAFHKAREAGSKYEAALEVAVAAVNDFDTEMKISASMIKKTLKALMPEGGEEMLKVTKITEKTEASNGTDNPKTSYGIGFAPRVKYPHPTNRKK
jgi:hypothetical protein